MLKCFSEWNSSKLLINYNDFETTNHKMGVDLSSEEPD